jgi:hypothetical protein
MRLLSLLLLASLALDGSGATFRSEHPLTSSASAKQANPEASFRTNGAVSIWVDPALRIASLSKLPAKGTIADSKGASALAISSIGEESLVAAVQQNALVAWRIDSHGLPAGDRIPIAATQPGSVVGTAANGHEYLVAWSGEAGMILGSIVAPDGRILSAGQTLVKPSGRHVGRIGISSDGHDFFVVWDAVEGSEWQTMAVLVSPEGPTRWTLPMPLTMNGSAPDIAWRGSEYLIVWQDLPGGGIRGRRVAPDGMLRSEFLKVTDKDDRGPRLVSTDRGFALIFRRGRDQAGDGTLMSASLNPDGLPVSKATPQRLAGKVEDQQYALAARGSDVMTLYRKNGRIMVRSATEVPAGGKD